MITIFSQETNRVNNSLSLHSPVTLLTQTRDPQKTEKPQKIIRKKDSLFSYLKRKDKNLTQNPSPNLKTQFNSQIPPKKTSNSPKGKKNKDEETKTGEEKFGDV